MFITQLHSMPLRLPCGFSVCSQFLACVANRKYCAILTTCYGAGLRVSEAIALTPPAVDSERMVLRVEQGKGMKDRCDSWNA